MNDITKARHYLKSRGSKLQHLPSFGLMLATAENNYRELRLRVQGNKVEAGILDANVIEAGLDMAVLRYLKKRGQLPPNVSSVFHGSTTLEDKEAMAKGWMVL